MLKHFSFFPQRLNIFNDNGFLQGTFEIVNKLLSLLYLKIIISTRSFSDNNLQK